MSRYERERAADIGEGIAKAHAAIECGAAHEKLEALRKRAPRPSGQARSAV